MTVQSESGSDINKVFAKLAYQYRYVSVRYRYGHWQTTELIVGLAYYGTGRSSLYVCILFVELPWPGVKYQRWSRGHKAKDTKKIRGQGQGQPFRGQTLSRPRTKDTKRKCSPKKKKRSSQKFFRRSPKKKKKRSSQKFFTRSPLQNVFQKIFQPLHKILAFQKIVLSSSRGQANF